MPQLVHHEDHGSQDQEFNRQNNILVNRLRDNSRQSGSRSTRLNREFHEGAREAIVKQPVQNSDLIEYVNTEPVFVAADSELGLYPQVAFKLIQAEGLQNARLKTAFVLSLYRTGYFKTDPQDNFDPSTGGQQKRARGMLQHLVYKHRNIVPRLAGPTFFELYPEYRN